METVMEHSDFVEKYRSNQIMAEIDKYIAQEMYSVPGLMPNKFRAKEANRRALSFGLIIFGIALFFFYSWYIALAVLLLGLYIVGNSQGTEAKGLLEASLQYPDVYYTAIKHKALSIRQRG